MELLFHFVNQFCKRNTLYRVLILFNINLFRNLSSSTYRTKVMYKIQTCFKISKLIFTQQQNILLRFNTGSRFTVQFNKKKNAIK